MSIHATCEATIDGSRTAIPLPSPLHVLIALSIQLCGLFFFFFFLLALKHCSSMIHST
eukprot:m.184497 g.184497  ORF g.184497 m.184497 type:complete len:58 (+) comp14713_c0_seq1:1383-1556(+)